MELKTFVEEVLVDLDSAISEANKKTKRDIRFRGVAGKRNEVEFDIAVTVESKISGEGKAGIKVLELIDIKGGGSSEQQSSTVSHIRFGLQVGAYTRKELKERK